MNCDGMMDYIKMNFVIFLALCISIHLLDNKSKFSVVLRDLFISCVEQAKN